MCCVEIENFQTIFSWFRKVLCGSLMCRKHFQTIFSWFRKVLGLVFYFYTTHNNFLFHLYILWNFSISTHKTLTQFISSVSSLFLFYTSTQYKLNIVCKFSITHTYQSFLFLHIITSSFIYISTQHIITSSFIYISTQHIITSSFIYTYSGSSLFLHNT